MRKLITTRQAKIAGMLEMGAMVAGIKSLIQLGAIDPYWTPGPFINAAFAIFFILGAAWYWFHYDWK